MHCTLLRARGFSARLGLTHKSFSLRAEIILDRTHATQWHASETPWQISFRWICLPLKQKHFLPGMLP